jgi:multiple sugar transport system substrate-binding protein
MAGAATPAAQATTAPAAGMTPSAKPAYKTGVSGKVVWLVRSTPAENKGQTEVFLPLIKRELPNVQMEHTIVPQNQYNAKINSMAAAGEPLEIWGFGGNYYDFWVRGLSNDLTSYIQADNWDVNSYFLPGLPDIYKIGGKYWGLPQLTCFGSIMVYNKTAFDQAGLAAPSPSWDDESWTTDKFVEYATKLTKNYGKPDGFYGASVSLWPNHISLPYLWGSDAYLPEHYTNFVAPKTQMNQPAIIDAFQWRQDLIWKHKVHPDPAINTALTQVGNAFATGRIGMDLDGGWVFWTSSAIKDFKVGFAPLPMAKTRKNVTFNDFWIMGRGSQNKDAAWQVMRVLTSVEGTREYSTNSGTPPTVRESLDTWLQGRSQFSGMSVDDLRKVTVGGIEKGRAQESPDHLFVQWARIDDTYNQNVDPLWKNQGDAKTIIPKVTEAVDKVVMEVYEQFKDKIPAH